MVSPRLKYPEVAGMAMGGISEVTTKTRAPNTAAKAIFIAVEGEERMVSIVITVLSAYV
jgi:hypothetical protein